jgi:transposase InsO family protein
VARFGLPRGISLLTDNGSCFISKLAKALCKAFNNKQFFTSPHHPQTNARAEEFADTIHKSLRILCTEQADWSKHLQAIAMAYRATATTNTGLSPHDVILGTPMPVALDWGLLVEDSTTPSADAYMADILPKIEAFREIATENARDSAERNAKPVNGKAVEPTFKAGDKVLLHNPVVKNGNVRSSKENTWALFS